MAKIIYNDIPSIETPWENYAGSSVVKFIKGQLNNKCGYIYRSRSKEGDYYYLYGFTDYEQFEKWDGGDVSIIPLFKVQLPNIENDTYSVNLTTNSNTQKLVNLGAGVKINLKYTSTSTNPTTGVISDTYNEGTLIISRSANGSAYQEVGTIVIQPTPYSSSEFKQYDITRFLADGDNKIRLKVIDNVNGSVSPTITFQSIINTTLRIENATPTLQPLTALQLQYYIEGQVAKTLHIRISQDENVSTFEYPIGDSTYIEVPYTTPLMSMTLQSGTINVDAWLSVDDTELVSYHEVNQFYYSDGTDTDTVIILNNVSESIVNYTNAHLFDMSVYNKNADVDIYIRSTDANTEYLHLILNDCQVGNVYPVYATLEIESLLDELDAVVSVQSADFTCEPYIVSIDNSEKMSPTAGADFVLNPKVRNNTEENPARIINYVNGAVVSSSFSGFGFINDGWVSDEDGIQVLRIPAEHNLTISYDVLDSLTNGTTFELDYKTYNVFDDTDVILDISSETSDNKTLGFVMNPTECAFYTVEKQTKRDQDVIFQDEERTHLAINIIPNLANTGLNYIRFFVNGVMNREIQYSNTDIFKNGTLSINIGSNNADIDIYGFRVYKKGLSATDVRQDYMSSIPTIEEKIAFKDENDILSSNGTISYDKAKVKYNTLVWTGRVPSKLTGNVQFEGKLHIDILGDDTHSGDITNLIIKGQGSSSRGYWKWNHQYDMDKLDNPSVFTNNNGDTFSGYALTDDDPEAKKLVAKLNWASSMQSHKIGSTALYNDFWKEIVGGNSITATEGFEKARVSVHEKPFLYFVKETDNSQPVFYGLMTFGSAKYDKPTFGYDKNVFPDYLILEGSDNGMPLTLRQVPWLDDEVIYNSGEEYYEYAGQGNLDYGMGNQNMLHYFKDAFNFSYLHSPRLKPYTNDSELTDASYQYWNTTTKNVKRYDWISESWVDAGLTKTTACEYHAATQEDVDNHLADKVGEKVVDVYPVYVSLNLEAQTGLLRTNYSSDADYNAAVISWRVTDFKNRISTYYNVNDVLYSMAILKAIAASDNWCKNTYEYLDPVTHKICLAQDDMDTLFLTDNVGRKTKPYYVEEHDLDGENKPYFNGDTNNFFCLMEKAFDAEEKNMMRQIFNTMRSKFETPQNCIQHYYFDVQEYFPAVAFNETARLLYEEASVAEAQGIYDNATPPITQSLGDQLQAEKQWWKRRFPYMQSWSSADPFYVRSTVEPNIMFRSMTTVAGNNPTYQFTLTPWQWLYPKAGTGQYLSTDIQRVPALTQYTTVTLATDGNTDTYIYGSDYYTSFGEFGGVSLSEAFRLNGKRLLEFSADSRRVSSYEFRPRSMTVNCPALKSLTLYGCSTLSGVLDLSGCLKLETVDLRGTNLSSVILPRTDTLTTAYLPSVASLTVVDCKNLNTFRLEGYNNLFSLTTDDDDIAVDIMQNASNLRNLTLINVGITTDVTNVDDVLSTLVSQSVACDITGYIYLDKILSETEISQLEAKFGQNVFVAGSAFYIEYRTVPITAITLKASNKSLFNNDSVTITASFVGNEPFNTYSWNVNSTDTLNLVKNKTSLVISSGTLTTTENITIVYSITRKDGTIITQTITISATNLDFYVTYNTYDNQSVRELLKDNELTVYHIKSPVSDEIEISNFNIECSNSSITVNDTNATTQLYEEEFADIRYTDEYSSGNYSWIIQYSDIGGKGEMPYEVLSDDTYVLTDAFIITVNNINIYIPFNVVSPAINITFEANDTVEVGGNVYPLYSVQCLNGTGTKHIGWTIPSQYLNIVDYKEGTCNYQKADSSFINATFSNGSKIGCNVRFTNVGFNQNSLYCNIFFNITQPIGAICYTNMYYEISSTAIIDLSYEEIGATIKATYQIPAGTSTDLTNYRIFSDYYQFTGWPKANNQYVEQAGCSISFYSTDAGVDYLRAKYDLSWNATNQKYEYTEANVGTISLRETVDIPYGFIHRVGGYTCSKFVVEMTTLTNSSWNNFTNAWRLNENLIAIELSDINNIGNYAFYTCTYLQSVILPATLESISSQICFGCSSLSSIEIPSTVTTIGTLAFTSCSSLTNINIPNSVTAIYNSAFSSCSNLLTITIGNSITSISSNAFSNCTKVNTIIINKAVAPSLADNSWGATTGATGSNSDTTNILYVPTNATGYDTTNWTSYLLNGNYGKFTISKTL